MSGNLTTQINNAIGAHGAWKLRLRTSIRTGRCDVSVGDASRSDLCEFGRWLEGHEIAPAVKSGIPYQVVRRLHAEFHHSAGQVLGSALANRKDEAEAGMAGDFAEKSDKLVRALTKWKHEVAA